MSDTPLGERLKLLGLGLIGGLVIGGIFAGMTWNDARTSLDAAEVRLESEKASCATQIAGRDADLAKAQAHATLLGARVSLSQALAHWDERNFGLAARAIGEARDALSGLDATAAGVDPAGLGRAAELAGGLTETIESGEAIRDEILRVTAQVDVLLR